MLNPGPFCRDWTLPIDSKAGAVLALACPSLFFWTNRGNQRKRLRQDKPERKAPVSEGIPQKRTPSV